MDVCYPRTISKNEQHVQNMTDSPNLGSAFKAYDIRALSPETINSAFAKRLGKAIASQYAPKTVMVGRDMRTTSFALEASLIEALTSSGIDVIRIGLCSTPMFNVLLGLSHGEVDLGVMVTASHNPGKYNGFKIAHGNCLPVGEGSGMEELRDAFLAEKTVESKRNGMVSDDPTALDRYVDHILTVANLPDQMPITRVAIDAGNGMGGAVLPRLLARLPWLEAIPLYFDPDGSFPNHEANPLKIETLDRLREIVVAEKCALGVAFDGDADRVGFVDELGQPMAGDILTALFAGVLLQDHPNEKIYFDVRSSWAVPEVVKEAHGIPKICKVGHANIKKIMAETNGLFGGELSMHFYFRELWNCESGDLAMLLMLKHLAEERRPLSQLRRPLERYVDSGEINFEVQNKVGVIQRLAAEFGKNVTETTTIDGLRMEFRDGQHPYEDWWFSVRASNTEPLLRLVVEARSEEVLRHHIADLSLAIQKG